MKKLLYLLLLTIMPICFSCSKSDDEQILPPKNDSIYSEDSSWWHNHVFGHPIYRRNLYMNDSVSVDTLYLVKGYYEMNMYYLIIYDKKGKDVYYADLDNLKDVTFEHDGKVLGYAKFRYYQLNTIEMYNWFKISEIQIDGKPAYEIRSTGTNPDSLRFSLDVYEEIPGGWEDGFDIY